ncbi:MAG: RNA polymerase sigma factor [Actinomycetota bacterium]|nr:RNA polymerase sigma factor [Actinomycetota bacterium]
MNEVPVAGGRVAGRRVAGGRVAGSRPAGTAGAARNAAGAGRAAASEAPAIGYSFETFFELEHDRLFGALLLVTGNRHDAEELMQEAFTRLWPRWDLVQSLANPTGYLYRTAMNLLRMRMRRARTFVRLALPHRAHRDAFAEVDARADVASALARLTERQRAALVLTELLGMPADEAARILRVRPSTIRSLATQARAALRRVLESPTEEPLP